MFYTRYYKINPTTEQKLLYGVNVEGNHYVQVIDKEGEVLLHQTCSQVSHEELYEVCKNFNVPHNAAQAFKLGIVI